MVNCRLYIILYSRSNKKHSLSGEGLNKCVVFVNITSVRWEDVSQGKQSSRVRGGCLSSICVDRVMLESELDL